MIMLTIFTYKGKHKKGIKNPLFPLWSLNKDSVTQEDMLIKKQQYWSDCHET